MKERVSEECIERIIVAGAEQWLGYIIPPQVYVCIGGSDTSFTYTKRPPPLPPPALGTQEGDKK